MLLFIVDMSYDPCFNVLARLYTDHNSYRICEAGTPHTATNRSNVVATYALADGSWLVYVELYK